MSSPNPFHPTLTSKSISPNVSFQFNNNMSKQCFYRKWAVEKKSWSDYNPGRRFLTFVDGVYEFFSWAEPESDTQSKTVINNIKRRIKWKDDEHIMELMRARNEYNEEVKKLKNEIWKWKFFSLLLLVFVVKCWFGSFGKNEPNEK